MVDTSSPGFVVQVVASSPDAKLGGRPDPTNASAGMILDKMSDVSPRVESFEFSDSDQALKQLKIRVDNFDLYFLDHPAWIKGNVIRFFWGYPGRIQGPFYSVVDSIRGFAKLEIGCSETTAGANKQVVKLWKNTTSAQIVYDLVQQGAIPGVTAVDVDSGLALKVNLAYAQRQLGNVAAADALDADVASVAGSLAKLKNEKPRDFPQNHTDWQFVLSLAQPLGFQPYVAGETLHFHPRRMGSVPAKRYEYYYGAGDVLRIDISEWRVLDRAGEIVVAARDPLEKKDVMETGSNATTSRDTLGNQGSLAQKSFMRGRAGRLLSARKVVSSAKTDPAAVQNLADAHFRQGEQLEVELELDVVGDPEVVSGILVEVAGIGRQLSGTWYVKAAHHKISTAGYQTSMSLIKNAFTALPSSSPPDLDPSKAKDNAQDVPADGRQSIVRDDSTGRLRQVKE